MIMILHGTTAVVFQVMIKKLDKKYLVPEEKKNISRRLFNKYMYGKENCDDDIYKYIDIPNARVIFLDNRFYAQKPSENDEYRTLLGEKQKAFLENALAHDLKYTFICSGLSLTNGHENFSKYTKEYEWFTNLISKEIKEKGKNIISLSGGDIHKNGFFLSLIKKIAHVMKLFHQVWL